MGNSYTIIILVFLSSLAVSGTVPLVSTKFPVENCTEGEIDLLLVTDTALLDGCIGPHEVKTFFSEIIDLFLLPDELTIGRLQVKLMSDTSTGLRTIFQFQAGNNSNQIKENISSLAVCSGSQTTQLVRESTIRSHADFIYNAFTEAQGSRASASHLAIVLISGYRPGAVDDIITIQTGNYRTNVTLFFVLVGLDDAYKTARLPNTISVGDFSNLSNNQLISMALCKKCRPGWFLIENQNPIHHLSCYFLDIDNGISNHWYRALSRCEKIGSNLASIETNEELSYLRRELYEALQKLGECSLNCNIFIGLRRDYSALSKQFKWINGHPMVVSHWQEKSPSGGYRQECGIWKYQKLDSQTGSCGNCSQYVENYMDGWDDIGCGVPLSHISLCEVSMEQWNGGNKQFLKIIPADKEKINSAISRGEFIEFEGKIVSIPANVENSASYTSLYTQNNGIELFNCQEDDGKDRLISYSYVCDFIQNCNNERDEDLCVFKRCDVTREFECWSHQCVPRESRCDMYADCLDESDEVGCNECKQKRCCEGFCVPKHWVNKEIDCRGHLDSNASITSNKTNVEHAGELCSLTCNRTSCVRPSQLGDDILDCTGPEGPLDETIGKLQRSYSCADNEEALTWAPLCVYVKDRYGGILGCPDLSHLWNCENFICTEGYAKCPKSYCIPLHLILDGNMDCPMGEDEQYLQDHSCTGNFACWNSSICLHPDLVCDGNPDCPFRDDEQNCHVTCANGFKCIGGTVVVTNYSRSIPLQSLSFIDQGTRYLDLSGLDISPAFSRNEKRQLGNLMIIILSNCKITSVEDSFASDTANLQSVYSLDISYNNIIMVPRNSLFKFMTNLHILNLSHNSGLSLIEEKVFIAYYRKSVLQYLDLSYTSISVLHSYILEGLDNLKVLDLSHTLISYLVTESFPREFTLQTLYLRGTPIVVYNSSSFNGLIIKKGLFTDNYGLCCPQIRGPGVTAQVCHAPKDAISSCSDLMGEIIQRVLLWIVGLIAVLGNLTVIVCRLTWSKGVITKAYGLFVTNLGISDLIMGLYLLTIASADIYYRGMYIINSMLWKHSMACRIAGFLSTLSSETSAFFVLLITIDRFLVIKFPFGQYTFSKRCMFTVSALAWVSGFTLALVPSLPVFNDWTINYSNGMCLGLPLTTEKSEGWQYSVFIFVGLNTTMFIVIAAGQFSIYRAMSANRADKSTVHSGNRRAQDIAVAKQLSLVVLTDFFCYFPVGLMGLLAITGHEIGKDAYTWSAVLVLPINSAINPMLYTVPFIQAKWEQFKRIHCRKRSHGVKTLNSKVLSNLSKTVDLKIEHSAI